MPRALECCGNVTPAVPVTSKKRKEHAGPNAATGTAPATLVRDEIPRGTVFLFLFRGEPVNPPFGLSCFCEHLRTGCKFHLVFGECQV